MHNCMVQAVFLLAVYAKTAINCVQKNTEIASIAALVDIHFILRQRGSVLCAFKVNTFITVNSMHC